MDVERINFRKLFRDVQMHVDVGCKLYKSRRTENDSIFMEIFDKLNTLVGQAQEHQEYLSAHVSEYDFIGDDGIRVKASGYRTVLYFLSCILQPLHQSLLKAAKDRSSFRYSASTHISSLSLHCSALQGAERLACFSRQLMEATPAPRLFNSGEMCWKMIRVSIVEYLSRDVFYGAMFGIQYAPNLRPILKMLAVGMASYEEWYHGDRDEPLKQLLSSLWKGSRYLKNSTKLGLKLDSVTTDCPVQFVKAFWSLSEQSAFRSAVKMFGQSVEITQILEVPAKAVKVSGSNGEVEVSPPSVHVGYRPIPLLLISYRWRGAQPYSHATKKQAQPLSPGLLVHMHGGGYVAQTPQSHEFYLRNWSYELDVPIVSIDYSLSPEAPYPRALEECVMAYCWILQHLEQLGTTGERIMFVGDSSGGNLAITTTMKLKSLGVRLPDSILAVYPSTNVSSSACPSRIMSIVDPILPLGILVACQQAYCNCLPSPEQLSLRKSYRQRIMKAQGYYVADLDARSPSWREKRRSKRQAKSEASKGSPAVSKKAPPRPPPPGSATKTQLEADSTLNQSSEVPLEPYQEGEEMVEVSLTSVTESLGTVGVDDQDIKAPTFFRQNPKEEDKLSPSAFEELVEEVIKGFLDSDVTKDPYMSPLLAPDEMLAGLPTVHIVGAALDSVLDDAISMAQKLKSAKQPVTLNVVDNLPHAFLTLVTAGNNTDMNVANKLCLDYMKKDLHVQNPHKPKKAS